MTVKVAKTVPPDCKVTVELLRLMLRPVELLEVVNVTPPLKPLTLLRLMLVELLDPELTVRLDFEEAIVKSTPATVMTVVAVNDPEVPVTVIIALPCVPIVTIRVTF